jgi:hypothetical protein
MVVADTRRNAIYDEGVRESEQWFCQQHWTPVLLCTLCGGRSENEENGSLGYRSLSEQIKM